MLRDCNFLQDKVVEGVQETRNNPTINIFKTLVVMHRNEMSEITSYLRFIDRIVLTKKSLMRTAVIGFLEQVYCISDPDPDFQNA